jgi:outer membrane protein TolC
VKLYVLSLFCSLTAQAQSLQAFLDSAGQRNIDARISQNDLERVSNDATIAWTRLLPALTANASYARNQYEAKVSIPSGNGAVSTATIIPFDQLDATFKVEVPIIDAAQWLKASAGRASEQAAKHKLLLAQQSVVLQVARAFYQVAGAESVLRSAQRSLQVARAQLAQMQSRNAAGVANALELSRATAEVQRCLQVEADAQNILDNYRTSLQLLSGLQVSHIQVPPSDDLSAPPLLEPLFSKLHGLSEVKVAQSESTVQERLKVAAGLTLVPQVSAQFTQRLTNATGFQNQSALWNAGLNLNWRLETAGVFGIKSADLNQQNASLRAEKTLTDAREKLERDWRAVNTGIIKVTASRAQRDAAVEGAALAKERFAAGIASQLDDMTAQRDLFAAEVNVASAHFELALARMALKLSSNSFGGGNE